jgi:hypothetical protein
MIIGRRIFMQGMAFVASAPSLLYAPLQKQTFARESTTRIDFKIDGWDLENGAATNRGMMSSLDSANSSVGEENVWIGVNRAWRANWR